MVKAIHSIFLLALTGFNGPYEGDRPTWREYWAWFDSRTRTQRWDDCSFEVSGDEYRIELD